MKDRQLLFLLLPRPHNKRSPGRKKEGLLVQISIILDNCSRKDKAAAKRSPGNAHTEDAKMLLSPCQGRVHADKDSPHKPRFSDVHRKVFCVDNLRVNLLGNHEKNNE